MSSPGPGALSARPRLASALSAHPHVDRASIGSCLLFVSLVTVLLMAVPTLARPFTAAEPASWQAWTALGIGLAALLGLVLRARRVIYQTLASLAFSVVLLTALMIGTIVGTLVLQGEAAAVYADRYGDAGAALVRLFGLADTFHTPWYLGLLGLMCVSLVATMIRTHAWRVDRWGHLLAHGGVIVVILGGWYGTEYGMKGMVELREGQVAETFQRNDRNAAPRERAALGFALRLDDFSLEHHEDSWRIFRYARDGEDWRATQSFVPGEVRDWTPLGQSGSDFKVTAIHANLVDAMTVTRPDGSAAASLSFQVLVNSEAHPVTLVDGVPGRDAAEIGADRVRFVWEAPPVTEAAPDAPLEGEHRVDVRLGSDGEATSFPVSSGETYVLADGTWLMEVGDYLPDFTYDIETRSARTASSDPRNPALEVTFWRADGTGEPHNQWLFAKMPDFSSSHGGGDEADSQPQFVYVHLPSEGLEKVVVGSRREVWSMRSGALIERKPLEDGVLGRSVLGLSLRGPLEAQEAGGTRDPFAPIPAGASRPAVAIDLRDDHGHGGPRLLGGEPVHLEDGSVLVLDERGDGVKAYVSRVSVIEGGEVVLQRDVRVNQPLFHAGFHVYQSNFNPDDPSFSGLLVVHDPGLDVVFAGFTMMTLGVAFLLLVRPKRIAKQLAKLEKEVAV